MDTEKNNFKNKTILVFNNILQNIEELVTIIVSMIIACIVIVALVRIIIQTYGLVILDFNTVQDISFTVYSDIFGKIMTLLISIEFMNSIAKVLRTHEIRTLLLDVSLITALSICRKLIIYDFNGHDALTTIALGVLLISVGVFYFLVRSHKLSGHTAHDKE
jgi:hypothetical protein